MNWAALGSGGCVELWTHRSLWSCEPIVHVSKWLCWEGRFCGVVNPPFTCQNDCAGRGGFVELWTHRSLWSCEPSVHVSEWLCWEGRFCGVVNPPFTCQHDCAGRGCFVELWTQRSQVRRTVGYICWECGFCRVLNPVFTGQKDCNSMCPCFEWRFCGVLGMEVCGVVNPMFTGQKDYRLPLLGVELWTQCWRVGRTVGGRRPLADVEVCVACCRAGVCLAYSACPRVARWMECRSIRGRYTRPLYPNTVAAFLPTVVAASTKAGLIQWLNVCSRCYGQSVPTRFSTGLVKSYPFCLACVKTVDYDCILQNWRVRDVGTSRRCKVVERDGGSPCMIRFVVCKCKELPQCAVRACQKFVFIHDIQCILDNRYTSCSMSSGWCFTPWCRATLSTTDPTDSLSFLENSHFTPVRKKKKTILSL